MVNVDEVVEKIIDVFSRFIEQDDIENGNRYLLAVIEALIYEHKVGLISPNELSVIARKLRDGIVEGPAYANPFIMEILGILEEKVDVESIEEALERIRRLHLEERLDRLEV